MAARRKINGIKPADVAKFDRMRRAPSRMPRRNALDMYQRIATKSAIYPGQGTPLGLAYCSLKLNGEAGEFAEHVGKAMRDDNLIILGHRRAPLNLADYGVVQARYVGLRPLTAERRAALVKEAGDVLWYVSALCNELGLKLSDVASANLHKLSDRTKRDKLRGSGDNR